MKNNQNELTAAELDGAELLAEGGAEQRARRARFVFTYLFLFLACILISTCIWLAVHFFEDNGAGKTQGEPVLAESSVSELEFNA